MNMAFQNFVRKTRLAQSIINYCVIVYMDDILVYSSSYEGHVQHIEWAPHALRDAGFKVALEKCQFFLTTISFLGHVVTDKWLQPEPQKVVAVRDAPVPTTIAQVRAFLGLASYYRRFIKGFAMIAGPLMNQLRKDQPLIWMPKCDQAFSKLKATLISVPVLIRPDPEKPFLLITVWQPEAISTILAQVGPSGLESVVEYASKLVPAFKRNYAAPTGECYATLWGIRHFRAYLYGRKFTLVTDHEPLLALKKSKDYSGMIERWATVLQSMDFDIRHRKHERHGNANGLTRLHRPEKVSKSEEVIPWNEPEQEIGPRYGQVEILSKHCGRRDHAVKSGGDRLVKGWATRDGGRSVEDLEVSETRLAGESVAGLATSLHGGSVEGSATTRLHRRAVERSGATRLAGRSVKEWQTRLGELPVVDGSSTGLGELLPVEGSTTRLRGLPVDGRATGLGLGVLTVERPAISLTDNDVLVRATGRGTGYFPYRSPARSGGSALGVDGLHSPIDVPTTSSSCGRPVAVPDTSPTGRRTPCTSADRRHLQSPPALPAEAAIDIAQWNLLSPPRSIVSDAASQPPMQEGDGTISYRLFVTDIALSPNGSQLYYILSERLMLRNATNVRDYKNQILSYRKADLQPTLAGVPSRPVMGDVISYWWPTVSQNGTRVTSLQACDQTAFACNMTIPEAMVVSQSGTHLILSPRRVSPPNLVSLGVQEGARIATPMSAESFQTLATDPSRSTVYAASEQSILAIAVDPSGIPTGAPNVETVATYEPPPVVGGVVPIQVSPQSFVASENGSCLYIIENNHRQLLALPFSNATSSSSPSSSTPNFVQVVEGLNPNNTVFMQTLVTTSDGCNVFITDVDRDGLRGYLRWVKVRSPCRAGGSVEMVASYAGQSMWGLALLEREEETLLYVGTSDGQVIELQVNKSYLHSCVPFRPRPPTPPPASSPAPSPLVPPSSSSSSPPGLISLPPLSTPITSEPADSTSGPDESADSSSPLHLVLRIVLPLTAVSVVAAVLVLFWCYCIARQANRNDDHLVPRSKGGGEEAGGGEGGGGGGGGGFLFSSSFPTPSSLTPSSGSTSTGSVSSKNRRLDPANVREFELATLQQLTDNFSTQYRIAERGGFGEVYRCSLENKELAIKVMTGDLTAVKRNQFIAEVNTLTRVHHANLIPLAGYCQEGNRSILVYPYFNGGSLCGRIHRSTRKDKKTERDGERESKGRPPPTPPPPPPLTLVERLCIAYQIAKGIAYLHEGASPPIIHRDIKSANVLLGDGVGEEIHVVVADFGLAAIGEKVFETGHEHIVNTSHVGGTFGYMSPEYMLLGELSEKNDVYAYGVLVLEMLSARKVVTPTDTGAGWQTIIEWIRPFLTERPARSRSTRRDRPLLQHGPDPDREVEEVDRNNMPNAVLDTCLHAEVERTPLMRKAAMDTLKLANECTHEKDVMRPGMSEVVERLRKIMAEAKIRSRAG
ncbi:hypothetical protein CBR_g50614 [Chara braunii]|uniref:Protein kinase domain-containing protein n=1 Tax=Chara braunii TaxID=69332 RepID=A0A388M757_CHABU|nr:hypothetical protein CBR_g50614 [Chara braunii]|eukprot:GBG90366.1 hypothetical protein CBR_g50614 [Chara braunii]